MNKKQSSYIAPVTLLFLAICIWFFWGQEQQVQKNKAQTSFEQKQQDLTILEKKIIEAEKIKEEYKEEGKEDVQSKIPNGMKQDELITTIEEVLSQSGFQTTAISFSTVEEKDMKHGELIFNFQASGEKSNLKKTTSLLNLLEENSRFFKIKKLDYTLNSKNKVEPGEQVELNLEIFTYFDPNEPTTPIDEPSQN